MAAKYLIFSFIHIRKAHQKPEARGQKPEQHVAFGDHNNLASGFSLLASGWAYSSAG
jgi:hypothetical protein